MRDWLIEARQFLPSRERPVVDMEKHDTFLHPKHGPLTRRETDALQYRGADAIGHIRQSPDVHGKSGNVDWMALHKTVTDFGYRTRSVSKGVRAYEHPQLKHSIKVFYNDPSNDAWAFIAGRHRADHKKGGGACQIGYSNEDLGTYLAHVHTTHAEGGHHPELCQHTDPRKRGFLVGESRFAHLIAAVLNERSRHGVGDAKLHHQHTRWYAARPTRTRVHPLQQSDAYHGSYGYGDAH